MLFLFLYWFFWKNIILWDLLFKLDKLVLWWMGEDEFWKFVNEKKNIVFIKCILNEDRSIIVGELVNIVKVE